MEAKLDNGEVVFFDSDSWLITNTRICWPDGVIRLSDVRRVEIIHENNKKATIAGYIAILLCVIAFACYQWEVSYYLHYDSMFELFLMQFPAIILGSLSLIHQRKSASLTAHCTSGDVVLMVSFMNLYFFSKLETFKADLNKMFTIQGAIGKALAASQS